MLRRFALSCVPDCEVTQHASIEGSLGGLGFHGRDLCMKWKSDWGYDGAAYWIRRRSA